MALIMRSGLGSYWMNDMEQSMQSRRQMWVLSSHPETRILYQCSVNVRVNGNNGSAGPSRSGAAMGALDRRRISRTTSECI
eukprot:gene10083-7980_t